VVEQPIRNRQVVGSTPTLGSIHSLRQTPSVGSGLSRALLRTNRSPIRLTL
jgi:hypothetical protein